MLCDECLAVPASVDHLDLSLGEARLRCLCAPCSVLELARWNRERLEPPQGLTPPSQGDRQAA